MQDDLAEGKVSRNHEEMPVLFFKKTDTNVAICGCFYLLLYFVTFIHRIESLHTGKQLIFTKERNLQKKKEFYFHSLFTKILNLIGKDHQIVLITRLFIIFLALH